jgi:hypothetical protein
MPNKTIYVREEDLPLWDELAGKGKSISLLFGEFLRGQSSSVKLTKTLRDEFAEVVLREMVFKVSQDTQWWEARVIGNMAYDTADDMMKARERKDGE